MFDEGITFNIVIPSLRLCADAQKKHTNSSLRTVPSAIKQKRETRQQENKMTRRTKTLQKSYKIEYKGTKN